MSEMTSVSQEAQAAIGGLTKLLTTIKEEEGPRFFEALDRTILHAGKVLGGGQQDRFQYDLIVEGVKYDPKSTQAAERIRDAFQKILNPQHPTETEPTEVHTAVNEERKYLQISTSNTNVPGVQLRVVKYFVPSLCGIKPKSSAYELVRKE